MSGTVCCYKGCSKSYSTDKDVVSFFKFPEEPKRRRKWMENCSNSELAVLSDRQLRLKRVCSDHFSPLSFMSAETRNQLTERSVPLSQKEHAAAKVAANKASESTANQKKRGPGRPPRVSIISEAVAAVKKEVKNQERQECALRVENEQAEEVDSEEEDTEMNGNDDEEYAPPSLLRRQIKQEGEDFCPSKPKGRPPKLKPKPLDTKNEKVKKKATRRKAGTVRKMADLSVIDDVVNELRACAELEELELTRKRMQILSDKRIANKRRRSSADPDIENSADDCDEEDLEDEEDDEGPERANREFEKFKETLKNAITLPDGWGMGGVIWDPLNKTKVIAASEVDVQCNGVVRLKRVVQIFEDSSIRITIDGIDMTINFGVKCVASEEEVEEIIMKVANCKVCCGVNDFESDDLVYLPYTKKRGCSYYSEACPVIITKEDDGDFCHPCTSLQTEVLLRKEEERKESESRRTRPVLNNISNEFGKSLYGLLQEILDDALALKSDKKQDREAVMSKYSNELSVMNGEIQKPDKQSHVSVSVDEVSASFQDIVSRLGFAPAGQSSADSSSSKAEVKPLKLKSSLHPMKVNRDDSKKKETNSAAEIKKNSLFPKVNLSSMNLGNHFEEIKTSPVSMSNLSNFKLSDGQEYELIGEVEGSEVVQVLEMSKDTKNESIEIIEVDDETMAKITSQNTGMFFQNSESGGAIQVATLDSSDPNISQILKSMNSSQVFKAT